MLKKVPMGSRDNNHTRTCSFGSLDTGRRVLEHQAILNRLPEPLGRQKEAVRCWLAMLNVFAGDEHRG